MPAVWIHSQPTILRSTSVSKSKPSIIDGVDVSFSLGNSTLLSVNSTLVGCFKIWRSWSVTVAVVVVDDAAVSILHITRAHTKLTANVFRLMVRVTRRRLWTTNIQYRDHKRIPTVVSNAENQTNVLDGSAAVGLNSAYCVCTHTHISNTQTHEYVTACSRWTAVFSPITNECNVCKQQRWLVWRHMCSQYCQPPHYRPTVTAN